MPSTVVTGLGIVYGPFVLLMILVPIGLLWGYDIDRKRHEEIRREIDEASATAGS